MNQKFQRTKIGNLFFFFFKFYAVLRMQQGRQKEPSVKTLRCTFSTEFWRNCVLSGGTQRHSLIDTRVKNEGFDRFFFMYFIISVHNKLQFIKQFIQAYICLYLLKQHASMIVCQIKKKKNEQLVTDSPLFSIKYLNKII